MLQSKCRQQLTDWIVEINCTNCVELWRRWLAQKVSLALLLEGSLVRQGDGVWRGNGVNPTIYRWGIQGILRKELQSGYFNFVGHRNCKTTLQLYHCIGKEPQTAWNLMYANSDQVSLINRKLVGIWLSFKPKNSIHLGWNLYLLEQDLNMWCALLSTIALCLFLRLLSSNPKAWFLYLDRLCSLLQWIF